MAQLNDLIVTGSSRFINDVTATQVRSVVNQSTLYGTGTAATTSGSNYIPAKWTFNTGQTVADGDSIFITIPVAGSDYGVFLSINNGTNYYPISVSGTVRLTTHYSVGVVIQLVFDADGSVNSIFPVAGGASRVTVSGGCWRVVNFYDSNSNTYDRNLYNATIKAGSSDIVAGNIIVGTNGTFHHLKDKTAFSICYPILYAASAISANGTGGNNYDVIGFSVTYTQSITLTAYSPVYIKGQLSGSTFTPDSTTLLTQTIPSSADGYEYMLLGVAYTTTAIYLQEKHPIFAYRNGVFGEVVNYSDYSDNSARLSNTSKVGDTNKPVYFTASGVPAAISYTIDKSVPSTAVFTDANLTQTATSTNANYEVLFSATADNTTRTEGARKYSNLLFNPSTGNLQATQLNGVNIGSSPKFTDTTYTFANGTNGFTVTPSGGSAQTVKVTPSITNNVTGSGTNMCLAAWNGTNTLTNGPAISNSTKTFLRNDGYWGTVMAVAKEASVSTSEVGTWTAMCRYDQTGSPTLPTNAWYNVINLNNWTDSSTNWVSQLAVATMEDKSGVWWRCNDSSGTDISSSTWHKLLDREVDGVTRTSFDFTFDSSTSGKWYCALYRSYNETVCWRGILTVSAQTYSYTPGYSQSFIVAISYRDIRLIPIESNSYYVDWITNWRVGQNSSGDTMYLDFQCTTLSSPYSNPFKLTIIDLSGRYDTRTVPTALAASQVSTVQYTVSNSSLFTPSITLVT